MEQDKQHIEIQDDLQQPIVLARPNRTKKSTIAYDYQLFLTIEENDLRDGNDPTSVPEAMKSENSEKWKLAMEDGMLNMSQNKVGFWLINQVIANQLGVKGCIWCRKNVLKSRPRGMQKGRLKGIKPDWLLKDITRKNVLIIMKLYLQSQPKTLSELLWF